VLIPYPMADAAIAAWPRRDVCPLMIFPFAGNRFSMLVGY
jgi:hypothetical protein